jgi:hypothetical protein
VLGFPTLTLFVSGSASTTATSGDIAASRTLSFLLLLCREQ